MKEPLILIKPVTRDIGDFDVRRLLPSKVKFGAGARNTESSLVSEVSEQLDDTPSSMTW